MQAAPEDGASRPVAQTLAEQACEAASYARDSLRNTAGKRSYLWNRGREGVRDVLSHLPQRRGWLLVDEALREPLLALDPSSMGQDESLLSRFPGVAQPLELGQARDGQSCFRHVTFRQAPPLVPQPISLRQQVDSGQPGESFRIRDELDVGDLHLVLHHLHHPVATSD